MLGIGREQAALEAMANARPRLANHLARDGSWAARYFPAFDLFVLSSRTEARRSLFEAMASEVPSWRPRRRRTRRGLRR
jgi:hypothetical protein